MTTRASTRPGRPLLFIGGLIGAWVIARLLFILSTTDARDISEKEFIADILLAENIQGKPLVNSEDITAERAVRLDQDNGFTFAAIPFSNDRDIERRGYSIAGSAQPPKSLYPLLFVGTIAERNNALNQKRVSIFNKWDFLNGQNNNDTALGDVNVSSLSAEHKNSDTGSRLSLYGYIFGRSGSGSANALGARYGGSQAAIQAAYRINPNDKIALDAVVRLQSALNEGDKELAAGVRVKPIDSLPVSIIAEHRFRPSSADGFAVYAAGGKSAIPLPANFKLNLYGQAGASTAGQDTLFFDAQAVAERTIYKSGNFALSAGGGAWAGGQRDAQRLDIGPSVSVTLSSAKQNYRLSGDWRERVGGNAAPNSGVAITLSTDF